MPFIDKVKATAFVELFPQDIEEDIWVGPAYVINSTEVVPFLLGPDKFIVFFFDPNMDDWYSQFSDGYEIHTKSRLVKFVNLKSLIEEERFFELNPSAPSDSFRHFDKGVWRMAKSNLIFQFLDVLSDVMLYHADNFQCAEYYYIPAHPQLQKVYERAYNRCNHGARLFGKIASPSETILGYRKLEASNEEKFEQHTEPELEGSRSATPITSNGERFAYGEPEDLYAYFRGEVSD